jgi:hypothetical protein
MQTIVPNVHMYTSIKSHKTNKDIAKVVQNTNSLFNDTKNTVINSIKQISRKNEDVKQRKEMFRKFFNANDLDNAIKENIEKNITDTTRNALNTYAQDSEISKFLGEVTKKEHDSVKQSENIVEVAKFGLEGSAETYHALHALHIGLGAATVTGLTVAPPIGILICLISFVIIKSVNVYLNNLELRNIYIQLNNFIGTLMQDELIREYIQNTEIELSELGLNYMHHLMLRIHLFKLYFILNTIEKITQHRSLFFPDEIKQDLLNEMTLINTELLLLVLKHVEVIKDSVHSSMGMSTKSNTTESTTVSDETYGGSIRKYNSEPITDKEIKDVEQKFKEANEQVIQASIDNIKKFNILCTYLGINYNTLDILKHFNTTNNNTINIIPAKRSTKSASGGYKKKHLKSTKKRKTRKQKIN